MFTCKQINMFGSKKSKIKILFYKTWTDNFVQTEGLFRVRSDRHFIVKQYMQNLL